ncbi:chemokine-like protein TAFA-4 isoform X3 [Chrysemys picta bellii]|uniref:chemokine-like protein TAFA-4 isoform X3 n=1 Tax=Chrysemys picta bellii TaxID=8478 RepID=UPI001C681E09|nr:chemokine-like protein TAFA-4 isoform X3 [Chrysemys picta bellii]
MGIWNNCENRTEIIVFDWNKILAKSPRMRFCAKSMLLSHWLFLVYVLMACCKLLSASSHHPRGHTASIVIQKWWCHMNPCLDGEDCKVLPDYSGNTVAKDKPMCHCWNNGICSCVACLFYIVLFFSENTVDFTLQTYKISEKEGQYFSF